MRKRTLTAILIIIGILMLHSTPNLSLRTHVFMLGHPKSALKTDLVNVKCENRAYKKPSIKCYQLTKPPTEQATQGILSNFKVTKVGFLYFSEYIGEE